MSLVFRNELPELVSDEFVGVDRYWDPCNQTFAAKIVPGEYYVSSSAELITSVIGTSIATCVRDTRLGIGGMNHFMLPGMGSEGVANDWHVNGCGRYGDLAMKNLLKGMLKHGAKRQNLKIKVFGRGQILRSKGDVGGRNIEFINEYIARKNLVVTGMNVGDDLPRKVNFFPLTGKVMVKKLNTLNNDTIFQREKCYEEDLSHRSFFRES